VNSYHDDHQWFQILHLLFFGMISEPSTLGFHANIFPVTHPALPYRLSTLIESVRAYAQSSWLCTCAFSVSWVFSCTLCFPISVWLEAFCCWWIRCLLDENRFQRLAPDVAVPFRFSLADIVSREVCRSTCSLVHCFDQLVITYICVCMDEKTIVSMVFILIGLAPPVFTVQHISRPRYMYTGMLIQM